MADTYIISTLLDRAVPSIEVANSAQMPYQVYTAALLLWNGVGSEAVIRVRSVSLNESAGRLGNALNSLHLRRVTAMTGGRAASVTKMNTAASSLPSQVAIVNEPGEYSDVGLLRSVVPSARLDPTAALRGFTQLPGPAWPDELGNGLIYTSGFSDVQSLTLRENEGLVLTCPVQATPHRFHLTAWLRVAGETYVVSEPIVTNGANLFGIGNATGSGVVVYVDRLEIVEVGDATLPMYTVERVDGPAHWNLASARVATVLKMDTTNDDLPADVVTAICAPVIQRREPLQEATQSNDSSPALRRVVSPTFGIGPGLASGGLRLHDRSNNVLGGRNSDVEHVLREGEGIAIMQRGTNSAYGQVEASIVFTATVTPSGGGGGESAFTWVG